MTQISRPFQILLGVFVLFAAVWFVALRGHNAAPGSPAPSPSSASQANANAVAPGKATNPASPTHVYSGPVPGLHGLTGAINKAHGAVAQSQADAKRFEHAEPAGSSSSSTPSNSAGQAATSAHSGTTAAAAAAASATAHAKTGARSGGATASAKAPVASGPALQATVERQLSHNRTVLILFWNPKGAEDRAVRAQLPKVAHALGATVAVHYSLPHAVAEYGKFTNAVQVNQTPTILLVNPHGQATTLTGFLDAYAIEQAVAEARAA